MKATVLGLCLSMAIGPWSFASQGQATPPKETPPPAATGTSEEQEVLSLSKEKWRWMSERKVDSVSPFDPVTYLAGPVFRAVVALLASGLPARRATKVDPGEALRCE